MTHPSASSPSFAPSGRVIRASEMSDWQEGEAYLAAARSEAERIVAEAQAERDRLIAEGRAEGERAGEAAITRRVADASLRLDRLLEHSEDWLAELVIDTVERILGQQNGRDAAVAAAATSLRDFRHARRLLLRIPPQSVDWMEAGLNDVLEPTVRALLVIQPDPTLREGRCVVASEFGTVEAGLAEQLDALKAGLLTQAATGDNDAPPRSG